MQATTPFRVDVVAKCPNCGESAAMVVEVSSVLEVDEEDSFLKLKSKSKKVDHLCGQIPLPTIADGQKALDEALDELDGTEIDAGDGAKGTISVSRPRGRKPKDES